MAKSRYSSNSDIFARRGDPWVSDREGREGFGRNTDSEDPDFDQFFAKKAVPKAEYRDPVPVKKTDYERQKANIIRKMHREIGEIETRNTVIEPVIRGFRPCPGCRKALCIARKTCFK